MHGLELLGVVIERHEALNESLAQSLEPGEKQAYILYVVV